MGHAAELLRYIFLLSSIAVDVLTHKLNPKAYGDLELIDAARCFLLRGGKIRILIEAPLTWDEIRRNPFVDAMICHGRMENLVIRRVADGLTERTRNLAVGDRRHYRNEHDRSRTKADGDFNSPEIATALADEFESLWETATEIDRGRIPDRVSVVRKIRHGASTFLSDDVPGLILDASRPRSVIPILPAVVGDVVSLSTGIRTRYAYAPSSPKSGDSVTLDRVR
ncbi:MAG: hypothetical protein HQL40_09310 [Alphaproteobacteria bacterium]|nr:hypothetical protein [Alphaproteobacteria bacterium]